MWNPMHTVCIVSPAFVGYDLDPVIKKELMRQGVLKEMENEYGIPQEIEKDPQERKYLMCKYAVYRSKKTRKTRNRVVSTMFK